MLGPPTSRRRSNSPRSPRSSPNRPLLVARTPSHSPVIGGSRGRSMGGQAPSLRIEWQAPSPHTRFRRPSLLPPMSAPNPNRQKASSEAPRCHSVPPGRLRCQHLVLPNRVQVVPSCPNVPTYIGWELLDPPMPAAGQLCTSSAVGSVHLLVCGIEHGRRSLPPRQAASDV